MGRDPDDDASLVLRVREGSRDAAGALVERHWRPCWRIALGIVGDRATAEDIVQESLIAALERLDSFDPGRGTFASWVRRITVNRSLNDLRRRRRHDPLGDAVDRPADERDGDGAFLAAIAGLGPDQRAAVVLRYGLDLSPPEIAEVLDVAVGTVNSRLGRALETLRQTTEPPHVR